VDESRAPGHPGYRIYYDVV